MHACMAEHISLPDPRPSASLQETFKFLSVRTSLRTFVHTSVRMSVSNSFSCVLLGQYTSDPNIFTDSGPPLKWLLGGLIRGAPDPPNPPYGGGGKIYFWGLLLMDLSDHQRVKYFWKALGFKSSPPTPLTPLDPYSGGGGLWGGMNEGGVIMSLTPKGYVPGRGDPANY